HDELTRRMEAEPATLAAAGTKYALPEISFSSAGQDTLAATSCSDIWTVTGATNVPAARANHTAIWTGSEMIVWGGFGSTINNLVNHLNNGGKYNPTTDSWTATSMTNAPSARFLQTAVWTGSQMIVWGGRDGSGDPLGTGGKYNPGTNSWTTTSIANAPAARRLHTAVWSGSQMIVWGGSPNGLDPLVN